MPALRPSLQIDRDEWFEEGMEKGREEGRKEMALKLIKAKMDRKLICEVTGFSERELKALEDGKL